MDCNIIANLLSHSVIMSKLKEEDTAQLRKILLATPELKLEYCIQIKDRPEYRADITDDKLKWRYCSLVEDTAELYNTITDNEAAYLYCLYVKDRPTVRANITEEKYVMRYLCNIRITEEMMNRIKIPYNVKRLHLLCNVFDSYKKYLPLVEKYLKRK